MCLMKTRGPLNALLPQVRTVTLPLHVGSTGIIRSGLRDSADPRELLPEIGGMLPETCVAGGLLLNIHGEETFVRHRVQMTLQLPEG